jgi:hypothetical protein
MSTMRGFAIAIAFCAGRCFAQSQSFYVAENITGQLAITATVNLTQQAQSQSFSIALAPGGPEIPPGFQSKQWRAPQGVRALSTPLALAQGLPVIPASAFSFNGLTHADQRLANGGNQFSVEPPSPGIAVANGYILEGVNNAVQVYSTAGVPLLAAAVSSNQLFGLPPAIQRSTGVNGPFPTDMRVFYDPGINRWFVLQRAQDNDASGNLLNSSHLYIAVSQTGDPTATYNVYTMDTTHSSNNFACPCVPDYPQVGADQYGFYISANEYGTFFPQFVDAIVLAIPKASLGAGAPAPPLFRFTIPFSSGFEFAIQPATTPPGASYLVANGGTEYFLSTQASFSFDSRVALWALTNTASMATAAPNLLLTQVLIPSLQYVFPDVATQRPGPLPYGSSLTPPGVLALIDGSDSRMLSVSYSGGRLFATFAAQVIDQNNRALVGGAYMILSPTLRSGVLNASVLRQGFLSVTGNHLLRPAIAVNPQGKGAINFTLVGPDYYPSAAFVPIDVLSTGTTVQLAAAGSGPEDGFSGYPGFGQGVARWGDYSAAVAAADGSIWMATEYIPNLPRTQLANWGTLVSRYLPQ